MRITPRAFTAAAVLTAGLTGLPGRASAQYPPEAAPLGGSYGSSVIGPGQNAMMAGGQPSYVPGPGMPGPGTPGPGMPGMPTFDPGVYEGPPLATDSLGSAGGAHGPRAWVGAEYLLYWTKRAPVPFTVATVGPGSGTGAIGSPGVQPLYGNTDINFNSYSGVRAIAGIWITQNESVGIEGNFFILPTKRAGTPNLQGSASLPVLARPFYDTANNVQNSLIVSKPGLFLGNIQTTASLQLWGAELGPIWRAIDRGFWTVDLGAAFKYLNLDESLVIDSSSNTQAGGVSVLQGRAYGSPSTLTIMDSYRTTNNFYGGTLTARTNFHVEAFTFSIAGKLGLGEMNSTVRTAGTSTISSGSAPSLTSVGGLYASGANIGDFQHNQFTVIPEVMTNLNVQLTSHIGLNLGYNYMYINNVLRPGNQITGNVNPNGVPASPNFGVRSGPMGATIPFKSSTFWAQGFNLAVVVGF